MIRATRSGMKKRRKTKVKARVYEQLLYRHWDHWFEGKRSHLFVEPADGSGEARDLNAGANYDVPPDQRGGPEDINFSPDSKELCFTAVTDKVEAISTNGDLFVVPTAGGDAKKITTNPGFDGNPVYSPDGRFIAYHAQLTPGYEADRWRVMLYDRQSGKSENLTEGFDRSANELGWPADSKTIFFHGGKRDVATGVRNGSSAVRTAEESHRGRLQYRINDQRRREDPGFRTHQPDHASGGFYRGGRRVFNTAAHTPE